MKYIKILLSMILLIHFHALCQEVKLGRSASVNVSFVTEAEFRLLHAISTKTNLTISESSKPIVVEEEVPDTIALVDSIVSSFVFRQHYDNTGGIIGPAYLSYEIYTLKGYSNLIITDFTAPLSNFAYFSFLNGDRKWETSPMQVPSFFMYISDTGYVAGIEETGDAWYIKMEFFKIDNFNNGVNKMIRKIGSYSSIGMDSLNLYIPYLDQSKSANGFWNHSKFYLKCLAIEPSPECRSGKTYEDIYLCFDLRQNE